MLDRIYSRRYILQRMLPRRGTTGAHDGSITKWGMNEERLSYVG